MARAVTFTSRDGYRETFPLDWLVERGAVIATKVGGAPLSESVGAVNQLWIPSAPARLFIRDIVSIDFSEVDVPPEIPSFETESMMFANRPNVGILGPEPVGGIIGVKPPHPGEPIRFEGYAHDYDRSIDRVEFSLDGGETWTVYDTSTATSDRWVYWTFVYTPEAPGHYLLTVRSVNEDGDVSPIPATYEFDVA